jgi:hypothetical protein
MKKKFLIPSVLIFLAFVSSFGILIVDGHFDKAKEENKILSLKEIQPTKEPIVLAKLTPVKTVSNTTVKKTTPVKKAPAKKPVVKKKRVNLAPPLITPQTAPYSAKNKYN